MELGILHNSPPSTKRGCRAGRLHRLWHGLPPAPWPCTRSQHHSVPSRNLHPLMVPPFLQPHPDLQSAVGNAPLSSKHPAQLPTTDCLLSIISPMGGQPSDAPALSPPSPLQQGGQSSNAPALSPPSPLPQGGQPIALALSPPSPPPQGGQPSDAPGLSPSSSTLLLCPSDSTLNICHLNSQSAVKTGPSTAQIGILMKACKQGDVAAITRLVQGGVNVNTRYSHKLTPLHVACCYGMTEAVQALLDLKADINAQDSGKATPLYTACASRHPEVVKLLMSRGADPNLADSDGDTPLALACTHSDYSVVYQLLLPNYDKPPSDRDNPDCTQVDVNLRNNDRISPLHIACKYKDVNIVDLLVNKNARLLARDKNEETPFFIACSTNNVEVVAYLFDHITKTTYRIQRIVNVKNKRDHTPLHVACHGGHLDIVKQLVRKGADLLAADIWGETPFFKACFYNRDMIVKYLLGDHPDSPSLQEVGFNVSNKDGCSPLHVACKQGFRAIVGLLVENHAILDATDKGGETPFFQSCTCNHAEVVEYLLDIDPNPTYVRACNNDGVSPLHVACERGFLEIVGMLVSDKANCKATDSKEERVLFKIGQHDVSKDVGYVLDPDTQSIFCKDAVSIKDKGGCTPFHVACQHGHLDIVKLLVSKGAAQNARDLREETPFFKACFYNRVEVVDYLFQIKPALTAEDSSILLCSAVRANSLDIVKTRLRYGMRVNTRGKNQETLLHIACQKGYYEMADLLVKSGASVNAVDNIGQTVLHYAVQREGNLAILKLLVANGAVVNAEDGQRRNALNIRIYNGDLEMRIFLINNNHQHLSKYKVLQRS
ncbi:hypothetical protein ACOMHN_025286 [Nucella lapillus]